MQPGGSDDASIGALAAGGEGALIGSGIWSRRRYYTCIRYAQEDVAAASERQPRFRLNREVSVAG